MTDLERLLAWIEPTGDTYVAAIVGKPAAQIRWPATKTHRSHDLARQWVETEASAVGLPVEWADAVAGRIGHTRGAR